MKYKTEDAPKRLFLVELEDSMKINGLPEEVPQQIRQTVVPNLVRKTSTNYLTQKEKDALCCNILQYIATSNTRGS